MTPPNMGGQNIIENTVNAGKSYAEAIAKSGVQKVVMLSSIGAEYENGTGQSQDFIISKICIALYSKM
jgi:nucleoside-diphosphate-sugar epimerase